MKAKYYRPTLGALFVLATLCANAGAQPKRPRAVTPEAQTNILLKILRHEDERRWDDQLKALLADPNPAVRKRAVLAAGRIGAEHHGALAT